MSIISRRKSAQPTKIKLFAKENQKNNSIFRVSNNSEFKTSKSYIQPSENLEKKPQSLYSDNKECQTPDNNYSDYGDNHCERFFKSHRNSIEKEVASIFRGSIKSNSTKKNQKIYNKKLDFRKLILNAKKMKTSSPVFDLKGSIQVNPAKFSQKTPSFPCNKIFESIRTTKISINIISPKMYKNAKKNEKFNKICRKNKHFQTLKTSITKDFEISTKINKVKHQNRSVTPIKVFQFQLDSEISHESPKNYKILTLEKAC